MSTSVGRTMRMRRVKRGGYVAMDTRVWICMIVRSSVHLTHILVTVLCALCNTNCATTIAYGIAMFATSVGAKAQDVITTATDMVAVTVVLVLVLFFLLFVFVFLLLFLCLLLDVQH